MRSAQWAWHPDKCSLQTFDAFKLSRKLAGRTVLFAGDAGLAQQFRSLVSLMCPAPDFCALAAQPDPAAPGHRVHTLDGALLQLEVRAHHGQHLPGSACCLSCRTHASAQRGANGCCSSLVGRL